MSEITPHKGLIINSTHPSNARRIKVIENNLRYAKNIIRFNQIIKTNVFYFEFNLL